MCSKEYVKEYVATVSNIFNNHGCQNRDLARKIVRAYDIFVLPQYQIT